MLCVHKFVLSNGVVLCERCGSFPQAAQGLTLSSTPPAHLGSISPAVSTYRGGPA